MIFLKIVKYYYNSVPGRIELGLSKIVLFNIAIFRLALGAIKFGVSGPMHQKFIVDIVQGKSVAIWTVGRLLKHH